MKKGLLIGIGIMAIIFAIFWFSGILGFRPPKALNTLVKVYNDSLGSYTRTINQLKVSYHDLEAANNTIISERDSYQNQLADAYREISALGIKVKNARSYTTVSTTIKDTFTVFLYDTVYIENKPLKQAKYSDGYLNQEFKYNSENNKLFVNYHISDTVMVIDSWIRQPNKKGEQVFYLWRWVKPWQIKVDIKSKNPNSEITNGNRILLNNKKR